MATKDVPPFSIVAGSYPVRWRAPNKVGLRRAGVDSARRSALQRALHTLFVSGESPMKVAESLRDHEVPEVVELAQFVLATKRGICAGPG